MTDINSPRVIAIDGSRAYQKYKTGTEFYSYNIISAILERESNDKFVVYTKDEISPPEGLIKDNVQFVYIPNEKMWTQKGLAYRTWKDKADVLFIPAHVVPFLKRFNLPVVVTVHDLQTEFLPQHSSLLQRVYLNTITEKLRAQLATHIIAVSESTKNDVVKKLRVKNDKVTVIPEGVDLETFNINKRNDLEKRKTVIEKHGIIGEYLFYVGTIQPRKNLERLIAAYSKSSLIDRGIKLVLAGKRGWLADEIYAAPQKNGVTEMVMFIDYVTHDDLPYLYAGAKAFVFPSLYEGFGLPILESLAMGTPVLTSNISSMPEVGGDFAVYVQPDNTESITKGLEEVVDIKLDQTKVDPYISQFNWQRAGDKTYEVLKSVMH